MSKLTVTIGIPAYNEEANIGYLIEDLLAQDQSNYELTNIIVASDASTDKTNEIVESFVKQKVILIANNTREGQAARQNQIIDRCDTDILILLNADILIKSKSVISSFVSEIENGSDLVCGPLLEIQPKTVIEKVLAIGSKYRREVFAKFNNGNNLFTCHGSHRAFSRRLYKSFRFNGSVAEDASSYLYCIQNGYKYTYNKDAEVYIKLPDNLSDHLRQSSRFFASRNNLVNSYDEQLVNNYTKLPLNIFLTEGLRYFLLNPIYMCLYIILTEYTYLATKLNIIGVSNTWKIAASSKNLRGQNI